MWVGTVQDSCVHAHLSGDNMRVKLRIVMVKSVKDHFFWSSRALMSGAM